LVCSMPSPPLCVVSIDVLNTMVKDTRVQLQARVLV
jgi:hypothetical protein